MANSAPVMDKKQGPSSTLVPPEERFWQRYSPHGEAPLSVAGSFAVHALAVGGLVLFAVYLASLFYKPTRSLPIDPVRLIIPGGGGGKTTGSGDGPGVGHGADVIGERGEVDIPGEENAERRPDLAPAELAKMKERFAPADVRLIEKSDSGKALARLDESLANKLRDGLNPGKGKGGSGSGGGKGTGKGTGEGPGRGPGTAQLSKRERRMFRWRLLFQVTNGLAYLEQLRGLGAILAFSVTDGANPTFKVVRDLRPGGKVLDDDVSKIDRIYWLFDQERHVAEILSALRIRLPRRPALIVVFMPNELEQQLLEQEQGYVERVLKKTFDEDMIERTEFRVVPNGRGGCKPELVTVTMK